MLKDSRQAWPGVVVDAWRQLRLPISSQEKLDHVSPVSTGDDSNNKRSSGVPGMTLLFCFNRLENICKSGDAEMPLS